MKYLLCILISYLIGTINPSYIIAKIRGFDIREKGSKNAGASNALILFGNVLGVACALFDIAKAAFAIWLCGKLFPEFTYSFSVAGVSCILGHIFPFYMKFRGGKGLACLGGIILAFDWRVFLIMLAGEIIVALATNYICFVPLTASVIFPVVYGVMRRDLRGALILLIAALVMLDKHKENLIRIKNGTEMRLSFLWNRDKELERMNISEEEKNSQSYKRLGEQISKTKFFCKREGLTIRGYEYRPQGANLPIAIVSHGFMANLMTVKHYAECLARMGYAAFCFDFNGGCVMMGKSDGKTADMSVLTEVRDLCAVIEYAMGLEYTDSSNILLMGCSQGGFVSALTAAKLKDQIRKLVLFYPALCIPDDARNGKMMWAKFDPQNIPEIVKCGPMKLGRCYIADVVNMDPFEEIKGYEGEVLIIHGTADKIVNLKYAEQAVDTYKTEPYERKVEYYTIEGGAHMVSKKHDKLAMDHLARFAKIKSKGQIL